MTSLFHCTLLISRSGMPFIVTVWQKSVLVFEIILVYLFTSVFTSPRDTRGGTLDINPSDEPSLSVLSPISNARLDEKLILKSAYSGPACEHSFENSVLTDFVIMSLREKYVPIITLTGVGDDA